MSVIAETTITYGAVESSTITNDPLSAIINDITKSGMLGDINFTNSDNQKKIIQHPFTLTNSAGRVILQGTAFDLSLILTLPQDVYVLAVGDRKISIKR